MTSFGVPELLLTIIVVLALIIVVVLAWRQLYARNSTYARNQLPEPDTVSDILKSDDDLQRIKNIVHHEDQGNHLPNIAPMLEHVAPEKEGPRAVRNQIFISYSHKDARWLERLQVHLRPLERIGTITRWDDTLIKPGTKWREEIERAIEAAKVAVLLVSADFLASDFIATNELPPLLVSAEAEGAVILPVIVSPCRFQHTHTLSKFQSVNPPSQPLIKMRRDKQEAIFVKVTEAIEDALHR